MDDGRFQVAFSGLTSPVMISKGHPAYLTRSANSCDPAGIMDVDGNEWTPERLERALVLACEFVELTIEDMALCRHHHVAPHAATILGLRNVGAALSSARESISHLFAPHLYVESDGMENAA